ncbi:UNVERIFIED_CONTAM: ABC transporter G family member 36 [Sesamum latifolium]|uniref:ABC transporter G family member 36 n=1 Tax=Sesamum latifolium TaxID=2727402 RepID=A0AAW2UG26_9LAMI
MSEKDQEQYWADRNEPYKYIPVSEFAERFKHFHVGLHLQHKLSVPYKKDQSHKAALVYGKYLVPRRVLLKANFDKEWLLIKRNSFFYVFKTVQIIIVAMIASTVFLRTKLHARNEEDGAVYVGALVFGMIINTFNGYVEISLTIQRLPVLFFKQLLWVFLIQQMAAGLFRLIAGICRTMIVSKTGGSLTLLLVFLLGGFILSVAIAISAFDVKLVHQICFPDTTNMSCRSNPGLVEGSDNVTRLGVAVLRQFDVFPEEKWYWIGIAALFGFTVLFNVLFTIALVYLNRTISQDQQQYCKHTKRKPTKRTLLPRSSSATDTGSKGLTCINTRIKNLVRSITLSHSFHQTRTYVCARVKAYSKPDNRNEDSTWRHRRYAQSIKEKGASEEKLQLLRELNGAFRPGVLTALMGVSGAGKTTLMDVLAGRKTRVTSKVKLEYLDFQKDKKHLFEFQDTVNKMISTHLKFVGEVMHLVELDHLKDAIVGIPGVTGLSTEQRKRLTIAVELVANPSILFMDEPTSGLDARAAAIVMRTLLLMKRGGQVIYAGPIGRQSQNIIDYFEAIPGVPKIREHCNPAAWMLEVSSVAAEARLGIDFGEQNNALVKELSSPPPGAKDLYFPRQYSQSTWGQFKFCLWKQQWTYWRSPDYNLSRFFFTLAAAFMVGSIFWRVGTKRFENSTDLMTIIGAMYASVLFVGINNCGTVQPVVAVERTVFYRERAAGMYSALPYAMAQVVAEVPYVFVQTLYYTLIVYAMVSFEWEAAKFFWFFFVTFFSFLYFTYYGMMTVSMTPNLQVAAICSNAFYYLFNLFSGFFIPGPKIPKWWMWYYWSCPMAWTVYGLIVSQYGDVDDTINVPGMSMKLTVKAYIEDYFGYNMGFMGPVAAVLVGFAFFFAFMYAYCIKTLNFQKR